MLSEIVKLGKRIYHTDRPRELHRFVVFVGRSEVHRRGMKRLVEWYQKDALRRRVLESNPFVLEQVTRQFFYKGSTFDERTTILRNHTEMLQERLTDAAAMQLLGDQMEGIEVWRGDYDGATEWRAYLKYDAGQRKEGLLGLNLDLGGEHLYQMMFWLSRNPKGEDALYIGAMQGPAGDHARELVKEVTKRCHRYRTKNLILFMMQAVARALDMQHIYAITNEGYYAQNHARRDRKLKTDFGAFWEEAGGHISEDPRFYELPLTERRKTMEEVPTRKRAVYRRRFAFQDAVEEEILARMKAQRRA